MAGKSWLSTTVPLVKTLVGILVICGLVVGCGKSETAATPPAQAAVNVKIAQPLSQQVTEWDDYTGRIEAINAVDIRPRVGGHLEKINFTAGAKVNKGDLLFLLDEKPFQAQLNFANAELQRAKTKHELAKNDFKRAENLYQEKAISTEELDSRSKAVRETAAAVTSAEANVYTAKVNLDYCAIRAPISGRISREMLTAGNLVTGGDSTVLASIVSTDPVYVYLNVDEQAILKYKRQAHVNHGSTDLKNTPVVLAVADENDYPHTGHIDYMSPREDSATGTVSLRAVFKNTDELLSPGFFARVRVRGSAPYSALLVPDRAISTDQTQHFVWLINKDNEAEYRQISLGARIGNLRVIQQGLQADDWLVVDGIQNLRPHSKVSAERITLSNP